MQLFFLYLGLSIKVLSFESPYESISNSCPLLLCNYFCFVFTRQIIVSLRGNLSPSESEHYHLFSYSNGILLACGAIENLCGPVVLQLFSMLWLLLEDLTLTYNIQLMNLLAFLLA